MEQKLVVAVIGCGDFARNFVPLFKAHPLVKRVYVCDILPERAQEYHERFDVDIVDSFESALARPDINTVAIFTQRHLHGSLVTAALRAGKHVYSAVPMGISVEECKAIIDAVRETGKTYMMGETCIYYPSSMFCKKHYEQGDFGRFVYAESQYYHDIRHFPKNFREDLSSAGVPPFFYPTHSTAMVLNATNSHVTRVVAFGYEDREENDPTYRAGVNQWNNVFSDEYALMKLANGGTARVNECRRIGFKAPSSSLCSFYGTEGSYQFNNAQHIYARLTEKGVEATVVSDQVNPREMEAHRNEPDFVNRVANHEWQWDMYSPQHDERRKTLPASYEGQPNGHMASHQLLIDDFVTAAYYGRMPTVNAWKAARYTIPGLLAHESALRGGEPIDVPDFGDAPETLD